jgi:hypothetical protein
MLESERFSLGNRVEHAAGYKSLIFRMDGLHPSPLLILFKRAAGKRETGSARKQTAATRIEDQHHERTLVHQAPKQAVVRQEGG